MSSLTISTIILGLLLTSANALVGHWEKTWNVESSRIPNANIAFLFSGHPDPDRALSESREASSRFQGYKAITLGGGNVRGAWSHSTLARVNEAINADKFRQYGYTTIAFDVEEGDAGLSTHFLRTFENAKRQGYLVVVTISHTQPYGFTDASTLMAAFLNSAHVDYISPMMYGSGVSGQGCNVHENLDTTAYGTSWSAFASSRAYVVPSLWRASQYPQAQQFLAQYGVRTSGYIVWCA